MTGPSSVVPPPPALPPPPGGAPGSFVPQAAAGAAMAAVAMNGYASSGVGPQFVGASERYDVTGSDSGLIGL